MQSCDQPTALARDLPRDLPPSRPLPWVQPRNNAPVSNAHSEPAGFYDDPLVYDVLHTPGTAAEVRGLAKIERRFGPASRGTSRWLEPACGSGRFMRAGAKLGIHIAGLDLNPRMIEFARARQPGVDARVADMRSFACERWHRRFALAFNTINTIRHLPSDRTMLDHLQQTALCLKPGGLYIVGLSLAHYGHEGPTEDVWTATRGSLKVTQIVQFEPSSLPNRDERVFSHLMIERPSRTEHRDSAYALRSYSLRQWESLVRRSPFRIVGVVDEQGLDAVPVDGCYRLFVLQSGE